MRSALALMKRILQQFRHDPRTVVMFIAAPVLVLWLFSVLLGGSGYEPKLAGVGLPKEVTGVLEGQEATFVEVDASTAADMLANREVDAILTLDGNGVLHVEVEGTDTSHTGAVMGVINTTVQEVAANQREKISDDLAEKLDEMVDAIAQMKDALQSSFEVIGQLSEALAAAQAALSSSLPPGMEMPEMPEADLPGISGMPETGMPDLSAIPEEPIIPDISDLEPQLIISDVELTYLHGSDDWNSFDFFGPVFIGIFIFTFVFITSGMSLITERTGGTMERLLATPIKPWQLVLGFCLGFGLVSLIQAALVLWACITLVGFPNEGSLVTVVTITFSLALVSLTLGLLVSGLARTPLQVIQFMLILVIPQVLLSGIFDLAQSPTWMQVLSKCFPITYGAEALRDIMLRGATLADVGGELGILWAFIVAFFLLATLSFAKRRTG